MNRLTGRVIVVTGAGRGIGAAVATLCGQEGASVVVNDVGAAVDGSGHDETPAAEVVNRITEAGGTAVTHFADVSDTDQANDLIETAISRFGRLDVLVNVAGILRDRMLFNMDPSEWDDVIRVHLRGTFNTTRAASRYWREHHEGHYRLINTTSGAGLYGAPGQPNYAAAKMGIVGFTYSCANALLRYGVTANVLSPSAATRMVSTIPDMSRLGVTASRNGAREQMTAENVAPAVAYVASAESDWFTGQVFAARGTSISLYNRPQVVRQLTFGPDRTVDDVFDGFEAAFRPAVEGTENHYELVARRDAAARRAANGSAPADSVQPV